MANTTYLVNYATSGDSRWRDVYSRNQFRTSVGSVQDSFYRISGDTALNTATSVVDLSGNAGSLQLFLKPSTTAIDVSTDTPVYTATKTSLTIESNLVANSITTINGPLTVTSDALFSSDLYIAGEGILYGDFSVYGNLNLSTSKLLIGSNVGTLDEAGFYFGNSLTTPTASVQYSNTVTKEGSAGLLSSIPYVFSGNSSTAQVSSNVTVYSSNTTFATMEDTNVNFSGLWRIRYDSPTNTLVFENRANTSASWVTQSRINSSL